MNRLSSRVPMWPKNRRLVNTHIDQQKEYYAQVQTESYINALSVSGVRGIVYNQRVCGTPCDCTMSTSLLTEDGELTEEGYSSIAKEVEHIYEPSKRVTLTTNNLRLDDDGLDLDPDFHEDEPINDLNLIEFGGLDQNRCGICFNTGYVGGYTVGLGNRQVLTYHVDHDTDKELVTANPSYFKGGTYIKFKTTLCNWPDQKVTAVRVWNNDQLLPTSQWAVIGIEWGYPCEINLVCKEDLTHLEIQTSYGEASLDFPQLPSNFEPNLLGIGQTTTIYLPPDCPVGKWSIVKEDKFNRTWQVTGVNPHYDTRGILVMHEVDVRLVAAHEIFTSLVMRGYV